MHVDIEPGNFYMLHEENKDGSFSSHYLYALYKPKTEEDSIMCLYILDNNKTMFDLEDIEDLNSAQDFAESDEIYDYVEEKDFDEAIEELKRKKTLSIMFDALLNVKEELPE